MSDYVTCFWKGAWTQAKEQEFVTRFAQLTVRDPWWTSACEQGRKGDPYLMVLLKLRVLQQACQEFGIPRKIGFWSLERHGLSPVTVRTRQFEDAEKSS